MNVLFNTAHRQSAAIRKDLNALTDANTAPSAAPPSSIAILQGQLSASLTSFSRTIDEYASLARQEPVPLKQEKAQARVENFRTELREYREALESIRKVREEAQASQSRSELFGRRPHQNASPSVTASDNPYANANIANTGPFRPSAATAKAGPGANVYSSYASPFGASPLDAPRENHALREQSFMSQTNNQLDEFLGRGRAVLEDLGHQREMLKGTQRKLYSVANTLGISGDTIRMVERRAKQDKWIFWVGVVIFFGFCWLVLRYLR